ncbi:MAG TPA: hypothetical protein VIV12_28545 [Streptosporangiaceae bacterium]
MSQKPHLRPVESSNGGGDSPGAGRQQPRQRSTKALPTDRMKMDRQVAVLGTLGRLSGPRKEPVNGDQLSRAVGGIGAATVILSNRFFADAGWIVSSGRGLYAATDALVEYTRRLATGTPGHAAEVLREPARRSWFWEILEPYLANGRLPVNEAAILLMREAGAMDHHMPMILNLIAWLEQVGLASVQDDFLVGEGGSADEGAGSPGDPAELTDPKALAQTGDEGEGTSGEEEFLPAPVVMFSLDVRVTVADLALLTPEQIKSFFEAVGTLAAVKNKG